MSKKETEKYLCKVIRNGFMVKKEELEIGTELQLTERQMKGLAGKIELVEEISVGEEVAEKTLKGIAKLKETNEALEDKVDELEEALGEKVMHIAKLKAELTATKKK